MQRAQCYFYRLTGAHPTQTVLLVGVQGQPGSVNIVRHGVSFSDSSSDMGAARTGRSTSIKL